MCKAHGTHSFFSCRYDCIENDLLGSLELGIHNIAPYKSKGIEKALELSACWNSKAGTADKYRPSDCGTSGKVESTFLHFLIHPCPFIKFEFYASVF